VRWEMLSPSSKKDLTCVGWDQPTWDRKQAEKTGLSAGAPAVEYEFGGPIGVLGTMIGLPIGIYGLYVGCNAKDGCNLIQPPFKVPDLASYTYYSHEAMAVLLLWLGWLVVLWAVLPGTWKDGVKLPDGSHLSYKLNGFSSMLLTYAALAIAQYQGYIRLAWLADHQLELATATVLFCLVGSFYLYISAKMNSTSLKADPGSTGCVHYDFFMGHELNPRIGNFDLKVFFELRPGLIGWTILNAAMAAKQFEETGQIGLAMWLVNIFQLVYVVDALWYEAAILTTMDVTTDGFGFMLLFGDLAWVPFTYGIQARYLAFANITMTPVHIAVVVFVACMGYYIFRGANGQKNTFRTNPDDPSVKHLETMPTERGTKLIISGWWGMARHINYFGDWLMAWSWCLPCGFGHVIPYFYVIYFAVLLVHREMRDEHACRHKYGKDWDKYCAKVKYHIIPGVY